jgi:pSer/pThr/pTyr-binding forkhead associated (FHA) protein
MTNPQVGMRTRPGSGVKYLQTAQLVRGQHWPFAPRGRGVKVTFANMAYLAVLQSGQLIARRELVGPMVIGRARESDVWVPDIRVSRRHCRIEPDGDEWVVVDLDSRNGTQVGGSSVRRHVLEEGDEVTVGDAVLRFSAGKIVSRRPADPEAALEAARNEMRGEREVEDSWREDAPVPRPQARPTYPGQAGPGGGGEDVPTGSTMLGYGREGSGLMSEKSEGARGAKGPPPELRG